VTVIALMLSVVLSTASLAWGYAETGFDPIARGFAVCGMIWLFSQWPRWWWFSSVGLFIAVLFAALGLWLDITPGWMFSGGIFALLAWDLTDFRRRIQFVAIDDDQRDLERRHIARLTLLALAGLGLSSIAMFMQVQFTFEWVILLVIVSMLGLTQLVSWIRRQRT
jgi:hypothetical protein